MLSLTTHMKLAHEDIKTCLRTYVLDFRGEQLFDNFKFLDFKFSSCPECCMLSFG